MYGAIIGDVVGSTYEFAENKMKNIRLLPRGSDFTDDTIMTIAVAKALVRCIGEKKPLEELTVEEMRSYGKEYPFPKGGYGTMFRRWLRDADPAPYNSFGNGSAMRVSPCGLIAVTMEEALDLAEATTRVTHNHPEGIKGAKATAAAVFLAKTGHSKEEIRDFIRQHFYPLDKTLDQIRPDYGFDGSCQGSVPESIQAFLESEDFEDAIRNCMSLGGDADTMGAITGAIAWSFYRFRSEAGISRKMASLWIKVADYLPEEWLDFIPEFDRLCRSREEAFAAGKVEPFVLA